MSPPTRLAKRARAPNAEPGDETEILKQLKDLKENFEKEKKNNKKKIE